MIRPLTTVSVVVSIWVLASVALAQTNLGSIVGTVRDTSGAVIPGITVKVLNEGTGWIREFQTLTSGDYQVTNLVAGTYRVAAEHSGFKKFVQSGIELDAGRTVRIDVRLEVGGLTEQVEVTASAPIVESETPSISTTIDFVVHAKSAVTTGTRVWEALPLAPTFLSGQSDFVYSIAGSRGAQNEFHVDGIASPGATPIGSTSMTVGGTAELQIQAVNNSAEYSQPGIYQQVSRSGTNQFHGAIKYIHENSVLNARGFFSATKAPSHNHKWGIWLGGPLIIPKLYSGKNKTFIMFSYEGSRNPGFSNQNSTVPTAAMRAGDFTGSVIRDPLTGKDGVNGLPFPNGQIPADRISAVSQQIQSRFYPLPNFGDLAKFNTLNYRILFDNSGLLDNGDLRIDHQVRSNNLLYGRLGMDQYPNRVLESGLPTIGVRSQLRNLRTGVVSDTHIFTPGLINEFRFGFQRDHNPRHGPLKGLEVLKEMGIQGIVNAPDNYGMPLINITGITGLTEIAAGDPLDQRVQMNDSVTLIRGKHTVKAGLQLRRPMPRGNSIPDGTYGNFSFTGYFSGSAYADFLLGLPRTSSRTTPSPDQFRRRWEWGAFIQDDFKLSPRLTVQVGLRYDLDTATVNRDMLYNFDIQTGKLVVPSDRSLSLISPLFNKSIPIVVADGSRYPLGAVMKVDKNNFGPRLGFAFRPKSSAGFVLRGGYGIFYDRLDEGLAPGAGPFTPGSESFTNPVQSGAPLFGFPRPFPDTPAGLSTSPPNISALLPDLGYPYVQQWNFTIEKAVSTFGLRASYIGTKGTMLLTGRNFNQPLPSTTPFNQNRRPFPLYQTISLGDTGGNSIYHALQLEAKRNVRNLTLAVGYTWSNTISDSPDAGADTGTTLANAYDRKAERGREPYAIKQRFVGNVMWPIPVGRGRPALGQMPSVLNHVLGGWETVWTFYVETGRWFTPTFASGDPSNTNTIGGRPDRLASGKLDNPTIARWFDPAAFAAPSANAGRFGNSGRSILEGPPFRVLHLGLVKGFVLREPLRMEVELAVRDLFNHPNFGLPTSNISSTAVAQITGMAGGLQAGNLRNMQLRANLTW